MANRCFPCAALALAMITLVGCRHAALTEAYGGWGEVGADGIRPAPGSGHVGFVLGDQRDMPEEARAALARLNLALPGIIRHGQRQGSVAHSPNGRSVAVCLSTMPGDDDSEPSGVWVWRDWRQADDVMILSRFSRADWVSNHHLQLEHRPRRGAGDTAFIDVRRPDHEFRFDWHRFDNRYMAVADDGRWAAATTDGRVVVGRLGSDDPDWMEHVFEAPGVIGRPIDYMAFMHQASVLVVSTNTGHRTYRLQSYQLTEQHAVAANWLPVAAVSQVIDDRGVYGRWSMSLASVFVDVSPDGQMQHEPGGFGSASGCVGVSPSGKFINTIWSPGLIGVSYGIRRSPYATVTDRLPKDAGDTTESLWLSWADQSP